MSHRNRILVMFALTIGLAGCEAECAVSTAGLSDAAMATAINEETKAPTSAASTFAADAPAIFATVKLSNAPADTKVKATFHYLEGGDRQITEDEVKAGGTCYVSFTLSPPNNGWPAGQYETRFQLNGKEAMRLPFNVAPPATAAAAEDAPASAQKTQAARPAVKQPAVKLMRDDTFGFAFEIPATWTYRVNPNKDYVVEGPKGTDAYELSVILQFVTKAANKGSSATAQAQALVEQIQGAPNGAIKSSDMLKMAGQEAPYFVATYAAKNSAGVATSFAHTQLVLDHGAYYYLISYSGPAPIYEKYLGVFQRLVETFAFTR